MSGIHRMFAPPRAHILLSVEISGKIGEVIKEGGYPELTVTESESDSVDLIYDIGAMTSQMIGSVKFASIKWRNVYETKTTVQDVPQANTFQ